MHEEVMTYIAECNNIENLGEILEGVKDRLEVIKKFMDEK